MARKRMIDPNIWQSEDFNKLSTLSKLVFIGLFSLADDEGRGRSNPVYLKSTLFPYEESIRSADIDKALSEISSNMSVIFYSCDGSNYYSLYNWDKWQKIDRPTPSKIPEFDESNKDIRLLFDEYSTSVRRGISPNKNKNKKENKKENKNNNASDGCVDGLQEVIDFYNNNIGFMTPFILETITDYVKSMGKDIVLYAMQISVEANKKTIQYIKAILNNWQKAGIKTLVEAKEESKKKGVEKKTGNAHNFNEREYSEQDFNSLYINL